MRTAEWTDSVSVLDRVTAVFDAFGQDDDGLGVSELARRANLPKSTVSRITADLVAQRFLDREGDKLHLGVRLFELGQSVDQPRMLRQAALTAMKELRDLTGHAVQLTVLQGADVVLIAQLRGGPASSGHPARVGARLPAHATAAGKAILAFSEPAIADSVLSSALARRTPQTICESGALRRELARIRESGFATDVEECCEGGAAVAAPLLAHGSLPVAAIAVSGPCDEVHPDRVAAAVRLAARGASRRVGSGRGQTG